MKPKEKILIAIHYLEIGGAESALLGLLMSIDYSRFDIDLFIYSHRGELLSSVPSSVNILPEIGIYSMIEEPMAKSIRHGYFRLTWLRLLARWKFARYRKKTPSVGIDAAIYQYIGDCITPILPPINPDTEYDLAISFLNPHNIVRDKVRAKKKIAWIHTDYSVISINTKIELPVWSAFDSIVSISPAVTQSFIATFPSLKHKIVEIENILPAEMIKNRAEETDASSELTGTINLLSIGRLCIAKNYDNIPDICRRIRKNGLDIKWYIVGYGGDEQLILDKIQEAGMGDYVILLGKKENPYPYIKACDIYVQPSRYEGKSMTVREAQILCKPVAITNYPTASSQIIDGVDGVIVPLDNEGCARGLSEFINNSDLQLKIKEHLRNHDYANNSEVERIYNLLK